MFVIIFQGSDKSQTQIKIPSLLLPISQQILTKQSSYLQQLAFNHFRDHLSPFIRKQHLQLCSSQGQIIKPDYPIFIYCNFKEYINNLVCTLKPYDEQAALKRSYLLKNSIVIVQRKNNGQKIVKLNDIKILDKKISLGQSVFIKGKQIQLMPKVVQGNQTQYLRKWSELVTQKWSKFQSENLCVYIMI